MPRPPSSRWSPSPTSGMSPRPFGRRWTRTWPWCATPSSTWWTRDVGSSSTSSTSSTATATTATTGCACSKPAARAGADVGVLCDTNGGMLPLGIHGIVSDVAGAQWRDAARDPLPGRHRVCGREHLGGRRGRGHARPVHGQRLRRAHRQRRPVCRDRQPRDQARPTGAATWPAARAGAGLARAGRARQHRAGHPPGLCRRLRLRAQGGPARQRDQGLARPLQPPRPDGGRQRHARPGHRDGRARLDRAQGQRARLRPRR